jgi:tetratricopeptide (TPR) repeat protein
MHRLLGFGTACLRRFSPFVIALGVIAVLGALPALGHAQDLAAQGTEALKAGRFADAVKAFDAAYRQKPAAGLLYNLGLAYKGMGFPGKALEALESYVGYADPKTDGTNIAAAKNEIERIKNGYARYAVKLTPASATIDIDGKRVAPENNELWVPTGKHSISIKADGFEPYESPLDVVSGRFDLEIQLRQSTMPPGDRAIMLLDEGVALEAAGDTTGALAKYEQAEALQSTPRGLGLRGLIEEKTGDLPAAETHLKASTAMTKDKWVRGNKPKMNQALRRIQKQLADLGVTNGPEAEGADLIINGRPAGTLPVVGGKVRAQIGSVTVQAKKPGYAMFEEIVEIPNRAAKLSVAITLEQAPAPVPVVVPLPVAAPQPAPVPTEPPPVEPIPIEPIKTDEPTAVAQADIEAISDPRQDLENEPQGGESATGFEAALNFGYHPGIGGPDLEGSSGTLTGQILLGARIIWPLSFGLAVNAGFDLGNEGTSVVLAGHPGFYIRGHIQREKKAMTLDVWGGTGIQPLSLQAAVVEPDDLNATAVDPSLVSEDDIVALVVQQETGVKRVHTLQTLNVPIELGATFYFTPAFGMDLSLGMTFWIPQQECLHDGQDSRFCRSSGIDTKTSFFIGGGFSFLP